MTLQVAVQGPAWQRSTHRCCPQASTLPQVPPQEGVLLSQLSSWNTDLPQWQLRRPSSGQPPQGPAWHTRSQLQAPHTRAAVSDACGQVRALALDAACHGGMEALQCCGMAVASSRLTNCQRASWQHQVTAPRLAACMPEPHVAGGTATRHAICGHPPVAPAAQLLGAHPGALVAALVALHAPHLLPACAAEVSHHLARRALARMALLLARVAAGQPSATHLPAERRAQSSSQA